MKTIPQFLLAAPTSGSGKTTISRGLMSLLVSKGYKVQPFKCGPDYIDTKFHAAVCGRPSINLDTFMASEKHVGELYARYSVDADASIVEGMMGMFDGYDRDRGSSAEIARLLGIPVVLVVDAKSAAYSMAPLLSGFIHFRPDVHVAGVIFNRVGSPRHYEMLLEVCEELNITCFGYLPKHEDLELESRHLGLVFSSLCNDKDMGKAEAKEAIKIRNLLTDLLEKYVDWQLLLQKTTLPLREAEEREEVDAEKVEKEKQEKASGGLRILVARNNESFSFIYEEHLAVLRRMGTVSFFNPEHNRPISPKTDLLYLPGGYPEECIEELDKAWRARESIRKYIEAGGKVLAECGGMMYLSQAIIDDDIHGDPGEDYESEKMVGALPFYITNETDNRKLALGYRQFDYNGQHLRGHEFHYTTFMEWYQPAETFEEGYNFHLPPSVAQVYNAKGQPVDTPVFRYKNVIASYTHLYWGEIDIMNLF